MALSGHFVFVRFFPHFSDSFPCDRFVHLRDEELRPALEAFRREWWDDSANRVRYEACEIEVERRQAEVDIQSRHRVMPRFPPGTKIQHLSVIITSPLPSTPRSAPQFLTLAKILGWRLAQSDDFLPLAISSRYPLARFATEAKAKDGIAALSVRVKELASGARSSCISDSHTELLRSANPCFCSVAEASLSSPEAATAREQIQRLSHTLSRAPTQTERYLWEYWPLIRPTLEQVDEVMIRPTQEQVGEAGKALDGPLIAVLRALGESAPRLLMNADIEAATNLGKQTVGSAVRRLIDEGYALRPKGPRKGALITDAGRVLLSKIR